MVKWTRIQDYDDIWYSYASYEWVNYDTLVYEYVGIKPQFAMTIRFVELV